MQQMVNHALPQLTAEAKRQQKMLDDTIQSHDVDELDVRMDALEGKIKELIFELGGPVEPLFNPPSAVSVRLGQGGDVSQDEVNYDVDQALSATLLNVGKMTLSENM